jgi:hypothetical protein
LAKLTDKQIEKIRHLKGILSTRATGRAFNVDGKTIHAIWMGKTWHA